MKRIQFLFLCMICSIYSFGQIKVDAGNNFLMPNDRAVFFNSKWAIQHFDDGLNFNRHQVADYRFYISDATPQRIGIGVKPQEGHLEIKTVNYADAVNGIKSGITLNPGTYSSMRMYLYSLILDGKIIDTKTMVLTN